MQEDLEHIRILISQEIFGTIGPEDLDYLNRVAAENPVVRDMRKQMLAEVPERDLQKLRKAEQTLTAASVLGAYRARKKRRLYLVSSAAALIGLVAVFWIYHRNNDPSVLLHRRIAELEPPPVELKFTSGEIFTLAESSSFLSGDARFINNPPILTQAAPGNPDETAVVRTPAGKDYHVKLADSSSVQLNSESVLRFPLSFSQKGRAVELSGEAYFNIQADPAHPFVVNLPNAVVEVLGTEFNISCYDSTETRIALVSGSVRVRFGGRSVILSAGTELVIQADGRSHVVPFDRESRLSWLRGVYVFHAEDMRDVLKVARRWYGVEFAIDNAALYTRKFTGFINRKDPVTVFLDNFRETGTFDYYLDENDVLHLY